MYASAWHLANETLWSVVNRGENDTSGAQISVEASDTRKYYDCYHGVPLAVSAGSGGSKAVAFEVEAGGLGCVLATPNGTLSDDTTALLATMKGLTSVPAPVNLSVIQLPLDTPLRSIYMSSISFISPLRWGSLMTCISTGERRERKGKERERVTQYVINLNYLTGVGKEGQ